MGQRRYEMNATNAATATATHTTSQGYFADCISCGCRYGVERIVRKIDTAAARDKPRLGTIISIDRWCQDCGDETE